MSFDSEPGRDDSGLPPVDVVIPDDARELTRDVIAYHRELRARQRRHRLLRLLGTIPPGDTGPARRLAVFPLIATCAALALLAGTMLSLVAVTPAYAPTMPPQTAQSGSPQGATPTVSRLPVGSVQLTDGSMVQLTALGGSVLALIPPRCGCDATLQSLARQASAAHAGIYFVYDAGGLPDVAQMAAMTAQDGEGVARTAYDLDGTLFYAFTPYQLTVLLAHHGGSVDVRRAFPAGFDLTPALRALSGTH